MMKQLLFSLLLFSVISVSYAQEAKFTNQIDSLLLVKTAKPFNGIVLISENGKTTYSKVIGYSDIDLKKKLKRNDQFVIGSISKQFTAVIVLKEFDKGRLNLFTPIHKYLPELKQSWADTVTVHHLLTHLHGITQTNKPTSFKVGSQYSYSQIGYDLLAKIAEKTSGKSFAALSKELFDECGMKNTFHPDIKEYHNLVKGYTENEEGKIKFESETFQNYVAAGSFISTVEDLKTWNEIFYSGRLLKNKTMKMLETKQIGAVRDHPIFGITEYGYGITIDTKDGILQLGQTGYSSGFVSMSYYFPKTKTSVIALENVVYDSDDLKKAFGYHTTILNIMREDQKNRILNSDIHKTISPN